MTLLSNFQFPNAKKHLLFFLLLAFTVVHSIAQESISIGMVLTEEGTKAAAHEESIRAFKIALKDAPINRESYFLDKASSYWECKEGVLIAKEDGLTKWQYPINLLQSQKSSLEGQIEDIQEQDTGTLALLGFLSSNLVNQMYQLDTHIYPMVSSIATASQFTIESRKHMKKKDWVEAQKWFFRATSPDIIRIEALKSWLRSDQVNSTLIFYMDNDYGRGLLADFDLVNNYEISYAPIPYTAKNNNTVDERQLQKIKDQLKKSADKNDAIILLGYGSLDSKLIKEIKEDADDLPFYVIEPNINEEKGQFYGEEFDYVKGITDQTLWNGDYEVEKFTKKFSNGILDNTYLETQSIPIAAGFAYDAIIILLQSIYESVELVGKDKWEEMSSQQQRDLLRSQIANAKNLPLIMSKGQITSSHDVVSKLQRCVILNNRFHLANNVPETSGMDWLMLLLGALVGGFANIATDVWNNVRSKASGKIFPKPKFILAYILLGFFGAVIFYVFWDSSFFKQILPGIMQEFTVKDDIFIIGIFGGFLPILLFSFLRKSYDNNSANEGG